MDQAPNTFEKRRSALRMQLQGVLLLSLVLVLLLLSLVGDSEHSSVDESVFIPEDRVASVPVAESKPTMARTESYSGGQASLNSKQADRTLSSNSGREKSIVDERRFLVGKGSKGNSGKSAQAEADSSLEKAGGDLDSNKTKQQSSQLDVSQIALGTGVGSKEENAHRRRSRGDQGNQLGKDVTSSMSRGTTELSIQGVAALSEAWGRSLGERISLASLPLESLGDWNEWGAETRASDPVVDDMILDVHSGDHHDVKTANRSTTSSDIFIGTPSSGLPTWSDHDESTLGASLRKIGFIQPVAGDSSVQPIATEVSEPLNPHVGDLTEGNSEQYEPIVQSPVLQATGNTKFGEVIPSATIAMTQLQSPVPGTTGPLAPVQPVGPGAGPAVNFPAAPDQIGTSNVTPNASSGSTGTRTNSDQNDGATGSTGGATAANDPQQNEEEASQNDEPQGDDPASEIDPEKHMISELVGSGYGWFGSVFDSGFYFANELTFLKPKNVGSVKVGVTDMLEETTVSEGVDSGLGVGNRLTLGVRGRSAGLQCQYWSFASDHVVSESWHDYRPVPRFITASSSILETVDLEITQQHVLFGCQLESSFGGRYAEYDGQDSASVVDQLHDSLELTGLSRATRYLRGAGPTLGLSGRKNLRISFGPNAGDLLPRMDCDGCGLESCMGDCESWRTAHPCFPWNLYWNGRIAWLWAEESSGTVTEATVNYDGGDGGASTARSRDKALIFDDRDSSIFTLGFQVGLEYSRPVFTRSQLTARVGYEYQHWDLGKNVAEAQSFAFLTDEANFGGRIDALAKSNRNYLTLSGFTLMVGLNY